jgi:hypothetical protein
MFESEVLKKYLAQVAWNSLLDTGLQLRIKGSTSEKSICDFFFVEKVIFVTFPSACGYFFTIHHSINIPNKATVLIVRVWYSRLVWALICKGCSVSVLLPLSVLNLYGSLSNC